MLGVSHTHPIETGNFPLVIYLQYCPVCEYRLRILTVSNIAVTDYHPPHRMPP
jgi:hypothetical protein